MADTTEGTRKLVVVIDDDAAFRRAIERVLTKAGYHVRLFASANAFLMEADQLGRGCLLLDVRMPGVSGLALQDALSTHGSHWAIVFLSGHADIPMSVQAMKSGAIDFLTKPIERTILLAAVESALQREQRQWEHHQELRCRRKQLASLTSAQRRVFERVTAGELNKQIAADLGSAERTIKAHRAEVMRKFEVVSLADLVRAAELLRQDDDSAGAARLEKSDVEPWEVIEQCSHPAMRKVE